MANGKTKKDAGINPIKRAKAVEILALPEFLTREEQAKRIGVVRGTLQAWLAADPSIEEDALVLRRRYSAGALIKAYNRLEKIIGEGRAETAVKAIMVLGKLTGEIKESHEITGKNGTPIQYTIVVK